MGLTLAEIPNHTHWPIAASTPANTYSPVNARPAAADRKLYGATGDQAMDPGAVAATGGGAPHENRQPFIAITWCIALEGVYPPRS